MITVRAGTRAPSSISSGSGSRRSVSCVAPLAIISCAPNFCACVNARAASSWPGDAGWKAEIVLDSRARAGLSAGRVRFEHEHIQSFGCPVDGRRQTGRAGADDHHVADARPSMASLKPRQSAICSIGRIAKHEFATADQTGTSATLT